LNNLGLLYGTLGLPLAKVTLLKRPAEKKMAMPSANLANIYVESGFYDDAEKLLRDLPDNILRSELILAAQQNLQRAEKENDNKRMP